MQRIAFHHIGVAVGLAQQGFGGADAQVVEDGGAGELAAGDGQGQMRALVGDHILRP